MNLSGIVSVGRHIIVMVWRRVYLFGLMLLEENCGAQEILKRLLRSIQDIGPRWKRQSRVPPNG